MSEDARSGNKRIAPTDGATGVNNKRVKTEVANGRPRTACNYCRRLKTKCDGGQPCSLCVKRGRPDGCQRLEYVTVVGKSQVIEFSLKRGRRSFVCGYCKKQRIKCDGNRPCDRCVRRGKSEECLEDLNHHETKSSEYVSIFNKAFEEIPVSGQFALDLLTNKPLKW
jgi:hypothetical protein